MIEEKKLAEMLGVTREELRDFRKENLYKDRDFVTGRSIRLTDMGAELVKEHFGVSDADLVEKPRLAADTAQERAVVKKVFGVNRRIIEVEVEGIGRKRVKVRNNRKFVVGQIIPVRGSEDCAVWRLGCPQPRQRGRVRWNG